MKRKFKLFATVASLCLSVALMAFGVYAATQVTYTVSGSVSFTAQVDATFTAGAYTAVGGAEANLWDYGGSVTGEADSAYYKTFSPEVDAATAEGSWGDADITFTSAKRTVVYRFECVNDGSQDLYVHIDTDANKLVDQAIGDDADGLLAVSVNHGLTTVGSQNLEIAALNDTTVTVTPGATYVWEITVQLANLTKALNTEQATLSISFAADYTPEA